MRTSKAPLVPLGLILLSSAAWAQSPRDSVKLNAPGASNAGQVGVASSADLTAVVWSDGSTGEVRVTTSDGRGVEFADSVRVDNDAASKTTQTDSVRVSGENVYVVWEASSNLYFSRSLDRGLTYSVPVVVDDGGGNVRDWRFEISSFAGVDHLFVLSSTAIGDEDLFLASSHNNGTTFGAAVGVPSVGSTGDVDALALGANHPFVYIAWDDNRSGRDSAYYQLSVDGGATFLAADVSLGDNVGTEDSQSPIEIAFSGTTVAVMWNEEPTGSGNETIQVATSNDGGLTFGSPVTPGGITPGADDTDFGDITVDPVTSNVLVTWEDNRTGSDEAYVATSTDGGLVFGSEVQLSGAGGEKPRFAGAGFSGVSIVWESTVFPRQAMSSLSPDAGATWNPRVNLSDTEFDSNDFVTGAYNELYGNFIGAWASLNGGDFNALSGGYRPQTLSATNLVSGQMSSFSLDGFPGPAPFVWILLSGTTNSMPFGFGEARTLGLNFFDPLFDLSITTPALFFTVVNPDGTGVTPATNIPVAPGFTFLGMATTFTFPAPGAVQVEEFTDVETFVVQ